MKKIFIGLFIALVAGIGLYYWTGETPPADYAKYHDAETGIYFEYPSGDEGYVLLEQGRTETETELLRRLILMKKVEYQSVLNGEREGGEGPPAITIQVFNNPSDLSPIEWAQNNPGASNFPLIMGEVSETSLAGEEAASYEADGLYASRNTILSRNNKIYMISGAFLDRNSDIYRDYEGIKDSLEIRE